MELTQLEPVELFTDTTVTSQTVYLNVLFPSKYRYYFELVSNTETPILIDHSFRLYFPQTITVEWVPPDETNGVYLTLGSSPEFIPFGPLSVQIYIPQNMYDAIVQAFSNPINSSADLVPQVEGNASGEVEFVLLSTDDGNQIKIDLVNTSYVPETPVTVKTLQWREVLYDVIRLPLTSLIPSSPPPPISTPVTFLRAAAWGSVVFDDVIWNGLTSSSKVITPLSSFAVWGSVVFDAVPWNGVISGLEIISPLPPSSTFEFAYTASGDLGITFIDPRYCFLREWITFPPEWTSAIKEFAGIE